MDNVTLTYPHVQSIMDSFSELTDPRVRGRCLHNLIDVIVITVCALVCGARYWNQVEEFGLAREAWLKQFLELPNGIPSEKTFSRLFSILPAEQFEACFREWASRYREKKSQEVVAIDGKTARQSHHTAVNQAATHLINAFATENGLTLAVEKTPDKSNEISGIPNILKSLELTGNIVTIDAMGCQKGIAKLIRLRGADYVLALKKNHKRFYKKVHRLFERASEEGYPNMVTSHHLTTTADHSRAERREYTCLPLMYLHQYKKEWMDLNTFIQVKSTRHIAGKKEIVYRYYITSLLLDQHLRSCSAIREHWHIENRLHWKLDVAFKEDQCRVYKQNSSQILSSIRKVALFYLESEPTCRRGIEVKQWKAAMDIKYLEKVLRF